MASYGEQLEAARVAHQAVATLEATVRQQIARAFDEWDLHAHTDHSVRYKLESIVRSAYQASSAMAQAAAISASDDAGWKPQIKLSPDYLQALITDLRRNLRAYKKTARDDAARRRAVLRIQHSAGVAAERGYTDALIASYDKLAQGRELKKIWLVNLVNNTPCEHCLALHGQVVGLHDAFKLPTKTLKVYQDLQGPPRHPNCKCYLAILIEDLENVGEELNIDDPGPGQDSMTTDDVKSMPKRVFDSIVLALKKVRDAIRRRRKNG